jgi:hypothetical protein
MVAKIVTLVFAGAILIPILLHHTDDRRHYAEEAWTAEALDAVYSDAISRIRVQNFDPRPLPPVMVAGMSKECLAELPRYGRMSKDDLLFAAHVCAGSDRSTRLYDNRNLFPITVGEDGRGNLIVITYARDWTDRERGRGSLTVRYQEHLPEEECARLSGIFSSGPHGGYLHCSPP